MTNNAFAKYLLVFAFALHLTNVASHADPAELSLSIADPNRIGAPGVVEIFQGTITNNTGVPLNSTDLFLNFSGYDPVQVTLDQLLGMTTFSISDGSVSGLVDLFTLTLASTATVPAVYSAEVVLQTSGADFSPVQAVSVTTAIPEPGSLTLTATVLLAVFLVSLRKKVTPLMPILMIVALAPGIATAQVSGVSFLTAEPGIGLVENVILIAVPITNNGTVNALNVEVTGATLPMAPLVSPPSIPIILGAIAPGQTVVCQTNFNATNLVSARPYLLTIRGTYEVNGQKAGFTLNRFIEIPQASAGPVSAQTMRVHRSPAAGPIRPQNRVFDSDVNAIGPPVPTDSSASGTPTPSAPLQRGSIHGLSRSQQQRQYEVRSTRDQLSGEFEFFLNNGLGMEGDIFCCVEPSGARAGQVVFVSFNPVQSSDITVHNPGAAYSTDGGNTFTSVDPTTIFSFDDVGGAFCCDQIVQYVPTIDRFVWLLQGRSGDLLAVASPADIMTMGAKAFAGPWELTPSTYGQPEGTLFDFPDLSVGTNYLYMSWNIGGSGKNCPAGCVSGHQVTRVPLLTLTTQEDLIGDYYLSKGTSYSAWSSHLSQNTGTEVFWAGHLTNQKVRIFSWADDTKMPFSKDVNLKYKWANNYGKSITPNGVDWLGRAGHNVIGATRAFSTLWFAWTAGTDSTFKLPHIEMVSMEPVKQSDGSNSYNNVQQMQFWSDDFVFAYPALATEYCTGEVGYSLAYSGKNDFQNMAVGFLDDSLFYSTTSSDRGPIFPGYGDYFTIRQRPNSLGFDAFGYGLKADAIYGTLSDIRYVLFGRNIICVIPY